MEVCRVGDADVKTQMHTQSLKHRLGSHQGPTPGDAQLATVWGCGCVPFRHSMCCQVVSREQHLQIPDTQC